MVRAKSKEESNQRRTQRCLEGVSTHNSRPFVGLSNLDMQSRCLNRAQSEPDETLQGMETTVSTFDDRSRRLEDRFPPPRPAARSWIPGMLEVQLRDGIRDTIPLRDMTEAPFPRASRDRDAASLLAKLVDLNCKSVVPSVRITDAEAERTAVRIGRHRTDIPDLRDFLHLQFPAEANIQRIAEDLLSLPAIVRAAPIPTTRLPSGPTHQIAVNLGPASDPNPHAEPLVEAHNFASNSPWPDYDPETSLEAQWYIQRCRVHRAWQRRLLNDGSMTTPASGDGVVVADIDGGFRLTHKDLSPNVEHGRAYNSFDGGTNVSHGSDLSHGTAVLGLIGAWVNGDGIAGIAYRVSLWPVQYTAGPGPKLPGDPIANAVEWVRTADSGGRRKVINLEAQTASHGNIEMRPSVNAAIRTAIADGVIVCVPAGNGDRRADRDDQDHPILPTGSVLVGATSYDPTENPRLSGSNYGSNYGPNVTVCAPGDIFHDVTCSDYSDDAYTNRFGGTSSAVAKVAAAAALLLQLDPTLTHAQVRDLLNQTGTAQQLDEPGKPVGRFLDCEAAVAALPRAKFRRANEKHLASSAPGHQVDFNELPLYTSMVFNSSHRLLAGIGVRLRSGKLTTLRLHARSLVPESGILGPPKVFSAGSEPEHEAEVLIGNPLGYEVLSGFGIRAHPGDISMVRLWTWDVMPTGALARLRQWRIGPDPHAEPQVERIAQAGCVIVAIEMRASPGDVTHLYARQSQLVPNYVK